MERILISGGTGFLGSYLVRHFLSKGHEVFVVKRSSSDLGRIGDLLPNLKTYDLDLNHSDQIFEDSKPDLVIHTACSYGRRNEPLSRIIESNLQLGIRLAESAIAKKAKTFINTDTLLPRDVNYYSLSKAQFAEWLKMLSTQIQVINLKIEHMYGPGDDPKKFISWLMKEMKSGTGKIALTSGIQERDFIHINDVVSAYDLVIQKSKSLSSWSSFDVGTGDFVHVRNFVLALAKALEGDKPGSISSRLDFGAVPYRKGDIMQPQLDSSALKSLGWQPSTDYLTGIKTLTR